MDLSTKLTYKTKHKLKNVLENPKDKTGSLEML